MLAFEQYVDLLPSAVLVLDSDCRIRFMNQTAELWFSTSTQRASSQPFFVTPALDRWLRPHCERAMLREEAISLYEERMPLPTGAITVTLHITPVMNKAATAFDLLITIEAIDNVLRMAEIKMKQETSRAAGLVASMLAHEVKNPLAAIRGAAQLLKEEAGNEHQPLSDLICRETDRISNLLSQVDIFSANAPVTKNAVNIHEVLQYVIHVAKTGFARDISFSEQYDPSLPDVYGQRELLIQLFLNLIKNAAEALHGQGDARIMLSTSFRSNFRGHPGDGKTVTVTVADNGPGIAADIRPHIFEPFVSSKDEGRGLGLAIVAKIATDLDAVVELGHNADTGAEFHICLPMHMD